MVYAQLRIRPWKWDTQTPLGFWNTNGSSNFDQTTRPNNSKKKKRTCQIEDLAVPADHRVKLKENKKKDKYLDLVWELKKTVEYECDDDTNCNQCSWYSHQRFGTVTWGIGNKRTSGDHSNYSLIKIDQNTEKSPGDLRGLAITQTPVRNHQLTLVWKTLKRVINSQKSNNSQKKNSHLGLVMFNNKKGNLP